ncbi:MAG: rRNA maturation RNase YbeY [bacterium]|jgi:probable rRNA maturation factor|nr:MAG: rRNA maturation RNase YbeY [bacterium]
MPPRVRVSVAAALSRQGGPSSLSRRGLERLLRRAALATFAAEGVTRAELSIALLSDAAIAELNHRYLGHTGPTDVISFPLYEGDEAPVGDVYIGYEQALRQAAALGVPEAEELARLAIHGTLHVLGYDHPEGPGRVRSRMWKRQERILREVMGQ